jgi:hypothetical protein
MSPKPRVAPEEIPPQVREWLAAIGRYGAAQREIITVICAICGTNTRGLTSRRYCGATCRQAARRRRIREASR